MKVNENNLDFTSLKLKNKSAFWGAGGARAAQDTEDPIYDMRLLHPHFFKPDLCLKI